MESIEMTKYLMNSKGWETAPEKVKFQRVSRWITVQHNYTPRKNNRLWDYVTDSYGYKPYQEQFNPENGLFLDYFMFGGRSYAVEQFLRLGSMWSAVAYAYEDKEGKTAFLSGYDMDDYYDPIFVEFDEYCEKVRVYTEG